MQDIPVKITSNPEDLAAWSQAVLSFAAVIAAIGLAFWQDYQRRKEERHKERVARLSAIGAVRLAVGHITTAAIRCQDPTELERIAQGFPTYVLEQADQAIAQFPIHLIGHEDGVEIFIGIRNYITSANIRIILIQNQLLRGENAQSEIGFLINEARILREELQKLRNLLAPGSAPLDANHPAELGLSSNYAIPAPGPLARNLARLTGHNIKKGA